MRSLSRSSWGRPHAYEAPVHREHPRHGPRLRPAHCLALHAKLHLRNSGRNDRNRRRGAQCGKPHGATVGGERGARVVASVPAPAGRQGRRCSLPPWRCSRGRLASCCGGTPSWHLGEARRRSPPPAAPGRRPRPLRLRAQHARHIRRQFTTDDGISGERVDSFICFFDSSRKLRSAFATCASKTWGKIGFWSEQSGPGRLCAF